MNIEQWARQIEEALEETPLLDVHTHLVGGRLGARGLHDVLLYHMVISDLYGAGCPSGARLTEYPHWPTREEAEHRITEALPYLPRIASTSSFWGVRIILAELYDWHEPITAGNWRRLDDRIRERADDRSWHHDLLDRMRIERTCTEIARRGNGEDDDRLQYALEWGFFTRCQWGECDTALYELERCWGRRPESPSPIKGGGRPATERTIRTLEDVHAALEHYIRSIPYDQVIATATHLSTDIQYRIVSEQEMTAALVRRASAGPAEREIYASYIQEAFLTELEKHGQTIAYQFSFAAEPLPYETASRMNEASIVQLAEMVARHPGLRFQCFLASAHAHQGLCTLARQLPNLSMLGYWWHNFFPGIIGRVFEERLDMLPATKQAGFFSDAYCLEWTWAKRRIVYKQMASVLAQRIAMGQFSFDDAMAFARQVLYLTPQSLLNMQPRGGAVVAS